MSNKLRLSAAEEIKLVQSVQSQDRRADYSLRKLIEHNTGLIHKVVNHFPMKNSVVTYDDLYQEGLLGFIHGVRKFDVTRGYRLSTYSFNWISAYVRKYYLNHYRTIRLPVHVSLQNTTVNRTIEQLTRDLGRVPTVDEVCDIHDGADNIICKSLFTLSLNSLVGEDGELQDTLGYSRESETEDELDVFFLLEQLKEQVSPRDYNILVGRYGLDGNKLFSMGFNLPLNFEESLEKTVKWTLENQKWLEE